MKLLKKKLKPLLPLQQKIRKNKQITALLVTSSFNLNYLSGSRLFSPLEQAGMALIAPKRSFFLVSPLIYEEGKKIISHQPLTINHFLKIIPLKTKSSLYSQLKITINQLLSPLNNSNFRLGFEENDLKFGEFRKLKEKLGIELSKEKVKLTLVPTKNIVENLRIIKTPEETRKIKKALALTKKAFQYIKTQLKPGKTEKQIAWQMEKFIRKNGSNLAFPIIVASGPNSSIPHYQTDNRKLKNNDIVFIDAGAKYQGYCADMTRTYSMGRPKPEWKKVYQIVKTSQKKVFKIINNLTMKQFNNSLRANHLDKIARNYIKSQNYGNCFIHNLGHGLGLEVHEKPYLSPRSKITLKAGMVFTIEPGIYLPGKFGIRIEDTVIL